MSGNLGDAEITLENGDVPHGNWSPGRLFLGIFSTEMKVPFVARQKELYISPARFFTVMNSQPKNHLNPFHLTRLYSLHKFTRNLSMQSEQIFEVCLNWRIATYGLISKLMLPANLCLCQGQEKGE